MKYENMNETQYTEIDDKVVKLEGDVFEIRKDIDGIKNNVARIECNTQECLIKGKIK